MDRDSYGNLPAHQGSDVSGYIDSLDTSRVHDPSGRRPKLPPQKKVSLQGEHLLKLGSSNRVPRTMKNSVITNRVNKFMNDSKDSLNMLEYS
jgi:hypothetical protein